MSDVLRDCVAIGLAEWVITVLCRYFSCADSVGVQLALPTYHCFVCIISLHQLGSDEAGNGDQTHHDGEDVGFAAVLVH